MQQVPQIDNNFGEETHRLRDELEGSNCNHDTSDEGKRKVNQCLQGQRMEGEDSCEDSAAFLFKAS